MLSPALLLWVLLLWVLLLWVVMPPGAHAGEAPLQRLVGELSQARGAEQATELELEIETLRESVLQPTVRLLMRRAQRELAEAHPNGALEDLDDALDLQPDDPVLWRERATAKAAAGDLDGAVSDLGGALSRDPSDVLAWQSLARIEEGRGAWPAAFQAWQHVMSLDPKIEGGAKRLDRLRRRAFGQPA